MSPRASSEAATSVFDPVSLRPVVGIIWCGRMRKTPSGADNTTTENLVWHCGQDDAVIAVTRECLRPNQVITLCREGAK